MTINGWPHEGSVGRFPAHDNDPRFVRWNKMADQYQPEEPFVFGGDSLYEVGG
jgi:hypothetical protein